MNISGTSFGVWTGNVHSYVQMLQYIVKNNIFTVNVLQHCKKVLK